MSQRRDIDKPDPNHADLWKHTDKKNHKYYLWESEKPEQAIAKSASSAASNAKAVAYGALPHITMMGISMLTSKGNGYISLAPLGLPVTIGGIVIDAVKAPICFAVATEEAARAGITKLTSLLFEKSPTKQEVERIYKSFLKRMRETATLLILLDLEQANVLDTKLKSGDIEELVGLTLLHTAYASRLAFDNEILLASGKRLKRDDCPVEGLPLFDKVIALKESIKAALKSAIVPAWRTDEERELEESRIVCQWIRLIKVGGPVTIVDRPEVNEEQLALVNKIISQIEDLKLIGLAALPEKPASVVSHMPKA